MSLSNIVRTTLSRCACSLAGSSRHSPTEVQILRRALHGSSLSAATEVSELRHDISGPPPLPPGQGQPSSLLLPDSGSPSRTSSAVYRSKPIPSKISSDASAKPARPAVPPINTGYGQDLPSAFGANQQIAGQLAPKSDELHADLEAILADFRAPIRYAFAYGSGVFKQAGYSQNEKPMLDFVFAVSHPNHWHSINIHQHKDHYSLMARMFGSNVISILQQRVGAGVWFNVECMVRGRVIKYGVISMDAMVRDLLDWETLYVAGRMQKPIHVLRDEPRTRLANQVNLSSAVRAALLLLPETFSEEDLYREITSLSYKGDFRMQVGENPNKVKNIVTSQAVQFSALYAPILRGFHKHISFLGPEGSGSIRQDINPRAKASIAKRLPLKLREMLRSQYMRESNILDAHGKSMDPVEHQAKLSDEMALWTKLVAQGNFKDNLDKSIQMIVKGPAFSQSAKGIVSVGPLRGVRYVWPKLKKKWFPG